MNNRLLKLFSLLLFTLLCPIEVSADDYSYQGTIEIKVGETKYIQLPTNIYSVALTGYYPQGKWVLSDNNDNAEIVSGWGTLQGCKVKGKKAGKNIKLTFSGNSVLYDMLWSFTGYYLINVVSEDVKVTSISLNSNSISLKEGATKQLTATVSPSNATDKSVSWSSSNTSVVSVNSSGLITAKSAGNATITCKANDGSGKQATCSVTVTTADPIRVTEITLNYTSVTLEEGNTKQLTATISPSDATDKSVTWSSSNTNVATVSSNGFVTAKIEGNCAITCKANDGSGKQATCSITVKKPTPTGNFKAKTVEGVDMQFYGYSDGTCKVYGWPAIDNKTSGKITIPSEVCGLKVVELCSDAFHGCKNVTEVNLPNTVKKIGIQAFFDCTSLTTITGISNVEYIGTSAFSELIGDKYIPWYNNLPDGLLYLGKVLYGYKGTMPANTILNVKEGTTQIGGKGFGGQDGLTAINIPKSVVTVFAIGECKNLKSIKVASDNPVFDSRNNCNAVIETATNTLMAGCVETTIPSTVKAIGYRAMAGTPIVTMIIPNSVESIAEGAFSGCRYLETVIIGNGLKNIVTDWLFSSCEKLGSIIISPSNPFYDSRDDCNAIIEKATNKLIIGCQNTIIPQTVTSIGENAFWTSNNNMQLLKIPDAVEIIEDEAFRNLYKLQSITFGKGVKKVGNHLLIWCYDLKNICVMSDAPFDIVDSTFDSDYNYGTRLYDEVTLYVPAGSKINYMTSNGWARFKNIVEFDPDTFDPSTLGIHDVTIDADKDAPVFDLFGRKLTQPRKGINIINGKKVIVK